EGIRDFHVTGGQTCALPILEDPALVDIAKVKEALGENELQPVICGAFGPSRDLTSDDPALHKISFDYIESCLEICSALGAGFFRSEERRVGKECGLRWQD